MADHELTTTPLLDPPAPVAMVDGMTAALFPRLGRIVRSLSVSVATTALSLSILAVLTWSGLTAPATANVIATVAGIGPSFALNRRWAWRRTGKSHLRREIIPFWSYALASLVASTLAVAAAAAWAETHGLSANARTVVVLGANIGSFAVLWCGQFLLLDRLLAVPSRPAAARVD